MIKLLTYIAAAVVLFGLGFGMAFDTNAAGLQDYRLGNIHGSTLVPQFNFNQPFSQPNQWQQQQQQQQQQQNNILQQQLKVQQQMLQQQRMQEMNRQLEALKIR